MTEKYLLKNVEVDGEITSLSIENGLISGLGHGLVVKDAIEFDFSGSVALPGLVDLHTHLREPGKEDAETVLSGSQAASRGGFVAVSAMANTSPVADTAGVVEQVFRLGQVAGLVDVFPIGAVTQGLQGEHLAEIGSIGSFHSQAFGYFCYATRFMEIKSEFQFRID